MIINKRFTGFIQGRSHGWLAFIISLVHKTYVFRLKSVNCSKPNTHIIIFTLWEIGVSRLKTELLQDFSNITVGTFGRSFSERGFASLVVNHGSSVDAWSVHVYREHINAMG